MLYKEAKVDEIVRGLQKYWNSVRILRSGADGGPEGSRGKKALRDHRVCAF